MRSGEEKGVRLFSPLKSLSRSFLSFPSYRNKKQTRRKGEERMIVYERGEKFVMVAQHHHALASGEIARRWRERYFIGKDRREDVLYGISQHDRGWIDLDNTPFWNDADKRPYSFVEFPLVPKLSFYRKGVDEVEETSPYGALLCSMHYVSFFDGTSEETALSYVRDEQARQRRLRERLGIGEEEAAVLHFHFTLLQFCDNLSLYICIQEPGIAKEQEISWYRNGFPQRFTFNGEEKISARWLDRKTVQLTSFPFEEEFEVSVPLKEVTKKEVEQLGIAKAYSQTGWIERNISFTYQ
jgi:hypothetical protein